MSLPIVNRLCLRNLAVAHHDAFVRKTRKEETGHMQLRASWRPRRSYPNREWMYRCVCRRARRSVTVSHWGRSGLIHRLSMGRYLLQNATRVCKQCQKAAGLHRCVRAGLIIGCISIGWCCGSIDVVVGASVMCGIGAVPLTGSPGSTHSKGWRP